MTRKRLSLLAAAATAIASLGFSSSALAAGSMTLQGPFGAAGTLQRDGCVSTTLEGTRILGSAPGATFALQVNDVTVATGQASGLNLSISAGAVSIPAGASVKVRQALSNGSYGIAVLSGVATPDVAGTC